MLSRLFGETTLASELRGGLTESARASRRIAHRVSNAANGVEGFRGALDEAGEAGAPGERVDLDQEMATLAKEQIRFNASAQLLQKVYQQIRLGIREV
jgi:flagellar hook-associated protein FlgK